MRPISDHHDTVLHVLGAAMIAAVAAVDYRMMGEFTVSLGHTAVILLALTARSDSVALVLATGGTLANIAIGAVELQNDASAAAVVNRGIALVFIWVVAILVQLTRRARSKDHSAYELLEENDIFQAVFNQTFQFVAALDSRGNIVEANRTLRDYAGLTKNEAQSMAIWLLPLFQNDDSARQRLKAAIAAAAVGDFVRDEFTVSGIGDQPTVIDLSLKPIREDGDNIRHIIMEARDITEARMQQEMLVQAQKMEAVGELTAGVAHDFNNLLMVIVGNLELLQKRLKDNEGALNRLDRAINAAFRGQALTQQLLAFSRRQSLDPAVVDVNTLLRSMSHIYESLGDHVEIEIDLANDLRPCEVDSTLLETALLNIAINARDAMPDGGTLRFETAAITLDEAYHGEITDLPAGDYICLAISDTGMGIPEETISQVFDPFFTNKPEGQGSGLGLSMVYGFVKQSGGDVKIYSEKGQGTTVRIYLPATDKPLPEATTTNEVVMENNKLEHKKVLLVDDDDEVRDVILNALKEIGLQVETAENGDAAIELIQAGNEYDLVFTDMVMAGDAGGPDVARAARAATPNVLIVFCSGFPRKHLDGEEAAVSGALFLAKPFHQEELVAIVERAFARA